MDDINFEWYKVFYNVVKFENITKAAENMYISQSAVTQSIQKLESELGGKVFYRTKQGVTLTEEGKKLYEYIKASIETMNNASFLFRQYINMEKGKIRIGSGNSLVKTIFEDTIIDYMKKYPNIEVQIESGKTQELLYQLSNGNLDIVLLNLPVINKYANIDIIEITETEYCFFASKELTKDRGFNKIEDIKNYRLIAPKQKSTKREILDSILKEKEINIMPHYEIASSTVTKQMVLKNVGIGFSAKINLEGIEDKVQVIDIPKKYPIGIAILKKDMCNKSVLKLYEMIKESKMTNTLLK